MLVTVAAVLHDVFGGVAVYCGITHEYEY